jgi:acyl-CoA synthetase (AMP-forming)/AMP-acid ligase II
MITAMDGPTAATVDALETLVELVQFRARASGAKSAFIVSNEPITYADLAREADCHAAYLLARGLHKGDRMVILLPTSREFFFGFFGAQRLGVIPVTIYPNSPPAVMRRIVEDSGAGAVFTARHLFAETLREALANLPHVQVIDAGSVEPLDPTLVPQFPRVEPDDLAFLQYTSGSTGTPKGVQLSHRNLLANVRALRELQGRDQELAVSWLPLYHDMGLIGMVLFPLYSESTVVYLSPDLRNLRAWLKAIARYRAQWTSAPDFAWRLCTQHFQDDKAPDLSSLRLAYSGGEPVRASTIREFQRKFGLGHVILPSYGLAEATLAVTGLRPGEPVREDAQGYVSVGRPFPGVRVRIVHDGRSLPPGEVGEIVVLSPGNTRGYWQRPEETAALFLPDGWLRTGDLGYLDPEGNLYVVGRLKNVIIRGGHNISPRALEEAADTVASVRSAAALGVADPELGASEQVVVVAETRRPTADLPTHAATARAVVTAVLAQVGFAPNQVLVVRPHVIPRTPNAKIQYVELKQRLLSGRLRAEGLILYPPTPSSEASDRL